MPQLFGEGVNVMSELEKLGEILWGGPQGPGLVHVVDQLAGTVEKNSKLLIGNGESGVCQKVEDHEEFVEEVKDQQKWLMRLLAGQFLTILIAGGWVILKVMLS